MTDGLDSGGVSLSFVFPVAIAVLLGWYEAALVAFIATAVVQTIGHRPPIRESCDRAAARLLVAVDRSPGSIF